MKRLIITISLVLCTAFFVGCGDDGTSNPPADVTDSVDADTDSVDADTDSVDTATDTDSTDADTDSVDCGSCPDTHLHCNPDGVCVQCTSDEHCPGSEVCASDNTCRTPCGDDSFCEGIGSGRCAKPEGICQECSAAVGTTDLINCSDSEPYCSGSGACVECTRDAHCTNGTCTDAGACVEE